MHEIAFWVRKTFKFQCMNLNVWLVSPGLELMENMENRFFSLCGRGQLFLKNKTSQMVKVDLYSYMFI